MNSQEVNEIFESLRLGVVPRRGIEAFAVGVEREREEIIRQLEYVKGGVGAAKFLRGGYGCGKTFMGRLAMAEARGRGFATSFVVVSDNDMHFHKFNDVYRKVMSDLGTSSCPRGALGDILDRWVGAVEERLENELSPEALDTLEAEEGAFDRRVVEELAKDLHARTKGEAPADFVRVIQAIFEAKAAGDHAQSSALLSWLSGSSNVAAGAKRVAGVKGDIGSADAMDYLRGVLTIVRAAGYKGLVIVIDEAETISRMRKDTRGKSLNGIRQILDSAPDYPGLLWMFTGTPEFYDSQRGVRALKPLYDRIAFEQGPVVDGKRLRNLRQAQLELRPFDKERLFAVAQRLRDLYPTPNHARIRERVNDDFLWHLVREVTAGFRGDVGVVPRQFLRQLIAQMDYVDQHENYVPSKAYSFQVNDPSPEERAAMTGDDAGLLPPHDDDDGPILEEVVW